MTVKNHIILLTLALLALALACPAACGENAIPKYDVTVALDPASPAPGTSAHATVHVVYFYYQQGTDPSVSNAYVSYGLSGPEGESSLSSVDGYTDDRGYHRATISIPSKPGDYIIKVYISDTPGGEIFGRGEAQFTVKKSVATPVPVTPTPTVAVAPPTAVPPVITPVPPAQSGFGSYTNTLLLIGAVVIVAILLFIILLAAFVFLWTRRKLVVAASAPGAPGDGQSAIPVRVKFTNGLGMARRMKEDTAVEMGATAGSIGNVIISKGTDAAEASLKTSKEFGTVTVTARAGKKTATAKVRFTNDNTGLGFVMVPDSLPADGTPITVGIRVVDAGGNVVAPLEDLAVDLKATLGKVTPRTVIKAKALEASAEFNPGTTPGSAMVTATAGALKGSVTLALKEKPGRYCMHCGAPMETEATSCPKCGLTPPSGVDTKQCPACGTVIPEAAKFCHKCGLVQPEIAKAVDPNAVKK